MIELVIQRIRLHHELIIYIARHREYWGKSELSKLENLEGRTSPMALSH